jgi:type II secretory pathway pseudopilin PulG
VRISRRAFTLIEIVISMSISLAILAVAASLVAGALRDARRARLAAELGRDAQLLDQYLRTEIPQIGLGVPTATNVQPGYSASGNSTFYASMIVADTTQLGFIGDFPRPDAQMNAFGILPSRPSGGDDRIFWLNDTTGDCFPDDTAGGARKCTLSDSSILFPGDSSDCTTSATGRLCPWSMRRIALGEPFQVVAGDGRWFAAAMPTLPTMALSAPASAPAPAGGVLHAVRALVLDPPNKFPSVWPNKDPGDAPGGIRGQGYVTTIDRVFYRYDAAARTVVRVQCWGDPDPFRAEWPGPSDPMPALAALSFGPTTNGSTIGGPTNQTCTPAEVVARNVDTVFFQYFDDFGSEVLPQNGINTALLKASIRRIDYNIELVRSDSRGRVLKETLNGSLGIRNR